MLARKEKEQNQVYQIGVTGLREWLSLESAITGVGSHFSKEYTEYWKRPNANKSNFSMEKNEYSYFSNDDCEFLLSRYLKCKTNLFSFGQVLTLEHVILAAECGQRDGNC